MSGLRLQVSTLFSARIERQAEHRDPGGYPRMIGDEKYLGEGRGMAGRWIRVIYVIDPPPMFYVLHAMPLTTRRRR